MSFEYIRKIPSSEEVLKSLPLGQELAQAKKDRDNIVRQIFEGSSDKFLVIVGPCSADNTDAVCEYVSRLKGVQEKVKDVLVLVPRIYTNKPRTTGQGYKGMAHQPKLDEDPNIVEGLMAIRKMHIRALKESGLTAADEMLYPSNYPYLEDLLSYVAIGARSVENQQHRLTVSGLDIPAGMKNPTSGDLNVMLNSIKAAQIPHTFIYHDCEVKTTGNPLTHAILRGAFNRYGQNIPNFHYEDMMRLSEMYQKRFLEYPSIIVDASHANSNKQFAEQPRVTHEVLYSMKRSGTVRSMVKGLMIESYLVEGSQSEDGQNYGQSITDPCLGWEDSEKLLLEIADTISQIS